MLPTTTTNPLVSLTGNTTCITTPRENKRIDKLCQISFNAGLKLPSASWKYLTTETLTCTVFAFSYAREILTISVTYRLKGGSWLSLVRVRWMPTGRRASAEKASLQRIKSAKVSTNQLTPSSSSFWCCCPAHEVRYCHRLDHCPSSVHDPMASSNGSACVSSSKQ